MTNETVPIFDVAKPDNPAPRGEGLNATETAALRDFNPPYDRLGS